MRIGLSVDALSPQLTGIGRYCWELVKGLPNHSDIESVQYRLGRSIVADPTALIEPGLPTRRSSFERSLLVRKLKSRFHASRKVPDLVHGPNYMLPEGVEQGVITVHDLSVFRFPETHPTARLLAFERDFSRSLQGALHVICDSEAIRLELIEFTGFSPERISAVPLGVGANFRQIGATERETTITALGLPTTGYGLTISSLEPRKRIERLISAWRRLERSLRKQFPLVVAGADGWNNEQLLNQIKQAVRQGWLIWLPFISEAQLPAVYSGASIFVFPSQYEGFGLPCIEAMACGVPTVVANTSCLSEVTGGAALLIDPTDEEGFAASLSDALLNDNWRARAKTDGFRVAKSLTWGACIENTAKIYRKVLS